jgi:hypothetical protein
MMPRFFIILLLSVLPNQYLNIFGCYRSSEEDVRANIFNPWIEEVSYDFQLSPFLLRVKVKEAEPWLVAEFSGQSWLISKKGMSVAPLIAVNSSQDSLEFSELPRIIGIEASSARFRYALQLIEDIEMGGGLPFSVESFKILSEGGLSIHAKDNVSPEILINFSSATEATEKIFQLQAVIKDLKARQEYSAGKIIDLRFHAQSVVRECCPSDIF